MFDPIRSQRPLIVYLDCKSPYAFIARKPTYQMAQTLGIDIDWRPLTLDIPSYLGSARLDSAGRVAESQRSPGQWSAVKYAYRDARRYAGLQGYVLRGTEKIWDTSLIHIAMLWVAGQGDLLLKRFLDDVLESFWKREFDAEDLEVLIDALDRAGADVDGFEAYATGAGRQVHDEMQKQIFAAGIYGVPTYVVEEEVYFGREHLPRVRWILEGRKGPAPDIAYELETTGREVL
ncbi:MAG: DsbA family protein [Pseudomonadales bacterium]|nr:DsbA family protein [Pseudomonadales bacterium]